MFSIIIPCFNKQTKILVTLSSVLQQTFQDFEVIIVDDGSTDNSVEVIQKLKNSKIKLIQQDNSGVSVARNHAIKQASGEWLAFLDADDWWHPQYLENIHRMISTHPNPNIVTANFFCKPDCSDWQPIAWPLLNPLPEVEIIQNLPKRWLQSIPFFTSSVCINKTFLQSIHTWFPEGESTGEDLDLWLRLAEKTHILYLPTELVAYRTEQTNSLTRNAVSLENPPFIKRMQSRAQTKTFPPHLKKATLLFSAQHKLTRARKAIELQERSIALKLLIDAAYAIKTKRWWMTLFMIFSPPLPYIKNWIDNRSKNKELKQ